MLAIAVASSVSWAQWTYFDNRSDVRALHEAGDTLWVATNGGVLLVNVLSGTVVSALTAADGLEGNSARTFHQEPGRMFVGTDEGLSVCTHAGDRRMKIQPVGGYGSVRAVSFGTSNTLYVCTHGRGVARIQDNAARWITRTDSLLDDKVFDVEEINDRTIYYGTSMGLCGWVDSLWVSFQAGSGLPRGEVRDIIRASEAELPSGEPAVDLYVLVAGAGVYRFDGRRARDISPRGLFGEDAVEAIGLSNEGTLWAAGRFGGIACRRDDEWTKLGGGDDAVDHTGWRCIHVGRSGIVYFGSASGTIAAFDGQQLRKISIPSALPSGHIGVMTEASDGRKYFACDGYLVSAKDDNPGFDTEKDFGSVLAIAIGPRDVPWVVSRWGLYRKEAGRWTESVPDIEPRPRFTSIAFDSRGALWAGDDAGGASRFDGELWMRLAERGELTDDPIDGMTIDSHDAVWMGSRTVGCFRFDGSDWRRYPAAQFDSTGVVEFSIDSGGGVVVLTASKVWAPGGRDGWREIEIPRSNEIGEFRTIRFDSTGRLYLGTSKGLTLVDAGKSKSILPGGGLRGSDVTSILIDRKGFIWVGFRGDGLSRISLEKLW
jgi:ligand-binding sensor domain-containing protein